MAAAATSLRQVQDRVLLEEMRAIFEASGGTSGSPRIHRVLMTRGHRVSRRRVERLMRVGGWRARIARVYRRTAGTHRWFGQHPNHVRRTQATAPNQIWVGDLTYLAVAGRWGYFAAVLDQYSRRLLAWRLGATRAVVDAARRRRRPRPGLIFHSDRGSEYLGATFRQRLIALGIRQSMTRGGAPGENAHMESFFHSLKADLVHGRQFQSAGELRSQLRLSLRFDNHQRLHSALGYRSPVDYEHGAA